MNLLCLGFVEGIAVFGAALSIARLVGSAHFVEAVGLSSACLVAFGWAGWFGVRYSSSASARTMRALWSVLSVFVLLAALYVLFPDARPVSEFVLVLSIVLFVSLRVAGQIVVVRGGSSPARVMIVGTNPLVCTLVQQLARQRHTTIVGIVDDGSDRSSFGCPALGSIDALTEIVERVRPTRIIVALPERQCRVATYELLKFRAEGIVVEDAVEVYERLTGKLAIEEIMPSTLAFATDFWPKSGAHLVAGRLLSLATAIYGLVGLAPLFALIALAIKLDSRGPVFFVQERVGVNGRPFKLIKFRTMYVAAGPTSEWVRDNQERITRVGKWLRRFRLDELPQFVNILRGDMNLVGPRPHPVSNFALFAERIPYYALRCVVRPGVTGWAQIRYGYANDLEEETEKMRYDLFYIKHHSLALDLRILAGSFRAVLSGRESPAVKMWEAA